MPGYSFNRRDADALIQVISQPLTKQDRGTRGPMSRTSGVWMMEATSAISAPTTTTPGSGTAKIQYRNPILGAFEDWKPNGVIVEQTVYTMTVPVVSGWRFKAEMDNFGTIYVDKILNATRYSGLINDAGGFASSDSTTAMDNLTPINGLASETSLATVYNIFDWDGDDNAEAKAEWNAGDEQWELTMVYRDCS